METKFIQDLLFEQVRLLTRESNRRELRLKGVRQW